MAKPSVDITGNALTFFAKLDGSMLYKAIRQVSQQMGEMATNIDRISVQMQSSFDKMVNAMEKGVDVAGKDGSPWNPATLTEYRKAVEDLKKSSEDLMVSVRQGTSSIGNEFDSLANSLSRGKGEASGLKDELDAMTKFKGQIKDIAAFTGVSLGGAAIWDREIERRQTLGPLAMKTGIAYEKLDESVKKVSKSTAATTTELRSLYAGLEEYGIRTQDEMERLSALIVRPAMRGDAEQNQMVQVAGELYEKFHLSAELIERITASAEAMRYSPFGAGNMGDQLSRTVGALSTNVNTLQKYWERTGTDGEKAMAKLTSSTFGVVRSLEGVGLAGETAIGGMTDVMTKIERHAQTIGILAKASGKDVDQLTKSLREGNAYELMDSIIKASQQIPGYLDIMSEDVFERYNLSALGSKEAWMGYKRNAEEIYRNMRGAADAGAKGFAGGSDFSKQLHEGFLDIQPWLKVIGAASRLGDSFARLLGMAEKGEGWSESLARIIDKTADWIDGLESAHWWLGKIGTIFGTFMVGRFAFTGLATLGKLIKWSIWKPITATLTALRAIDKKWLPGGAARAAARAAKAAAPLADEAATVAPMAKGAKGIFASVSAAIAYGFSRLMGKTQPGGQMVLPGFEKTMRGGGAFKGLLGFLKKGPKTGKIGLAITALIAAMEGSDAFAASEQEGGGKGSWESWGRGAGRLAGSIGGWVGGGALGAGAGPLGMAAGGFVGSEALGYLLEEVGGKIGSFFDPATGDARVASTLASGQQTTNQLLEGMPPKIAEALRDGQHGGPALNTNTPAPRVFPDEGRRHQPDLDPHARASVAFLDEGPDPHARASVAFLDNLESQGRRVLAMIQGEIRDLGGPTPAPAATPRPPGPEDFFVKPKPAAAPIVDLRTPTPTANRVPTPEATPGLPLDKKFMLDFGEIAREANARWRWMQQREARIEGEGKSEEEKIEDCGEKSRWRDMSMSDLRAWSHEYHRQNIIDRIKPAPRKKEEVPAQTVGLINPAGGDHLTDLKPVVDAVAAGTKATEKQTEVLESMKRSTKRSGPGTEAGSLIDGTAGRRF